MVEALENVKTLKSQVHGNDIVYKLCKIQSDYFKHYFILRTHSCIFYILDLENQDINNSSTNNNQNKLKLLNQIEEQITQMKDGKPNFTLIMDDPASNSYLQVP